MMCSALALKTVVSLLIMGKIERLEWFLWVLMGTGMRKGFEVARAQEAVALAPPLATHALLCWLAAVPHHCRVVALPISSLALSSAVEALSSSSRRARCSGLFPTPAQNLLGGDFQLGHFLPR